MRDAGVASNLAACFTEPTAGCKGLSEELARSLALIKTIMMADASVVAVNPRSPSKGLLGKLPLPWFRVLSK